ncbi:MAG: RodZ domain-containing protein [Terriglobales bacterium]
MIDYWRRENTLGFGDRLRREREMRGVSLEEMASATKIGTRALRALEREEFEKLPGGIFNKGFVRAYARFLGMDEEQSVADYLSASAEAQEKQGLDAENLKKLAANWERPRTAPGLNVRRLVGTAVLLLLLATGGVFAFLYHRGISITSRLRSLGGAKPSSHSAGPPPVASQPKTEPIRPPQKVADTILPGAASSSLPPTLAASPGQAMSPNTANFPSQAASQSPPPVDGNSNLAPMQTANPRSAATSPQSVSVNRPAASGASDSFEVAIFAREASWVSVVADGRQLMRGTLGAKETMSFRAREKMMVVAGNSGGVDVSFNGKLQPALGDSRTPRTVNFTPEGMLP